MTATGGRLVHAVLLGWMLVVAGCSTPATTNVTGPAGADLRAQVEDIEQRLRGSVDSDGHVTVNNAHGLVVSRCMQDAGFDFQTGMVTAEEQARMTSGGLSTFDVWMFDDVEGAERLGYGARSGREPGPPPEPADPGRTPDVDSFPPDEQERFWLTLFGSDEERVEIVEADGGTTSVPGGGCMGMATVVIYGDIEQHLRFEDARNTAMLRVEDRVAADRDVAAANSLWRRCMGDVGYEVDDPFHALEQAADVGDPTATTSMAVADATCKRSTGLSTVYGEAVISAGSEVLAEFDDQLIAYDEFEQAAVERARSALGIDAEQ